MRVVSWNVNGLRAADRKGFLAWLQGSGAHVVGVQETRARPEQLREKLRDPEGWHFDMVMAARKGYSGVGIYSRARPDAIESGLGIARFDAEGRYQAASFGPLIVANVYFPNGNGTVLPNGRRSNDRVPYKLDFYRAVFDRLEPERRAGRPILVMGDFNTAHTELDLARPRDNKKTSGFLEDEREELDRWLRAGWVDTFREQHPGEEGHYSWWVQRSRCRERNVGWRIDYVLASEPAAAAVTEAFIWKDVTGSDHCPVGVTLDPAALDG